jgi:hypothetical protein
MNLSEEDLRSIWLNAYNAALTGQLAQGIDKTLIGVEQVGHACVLYADQAVKDAREKT